MSLKISLPPTTLADDPTFDCAEDDFPVVFKDGIW